MKIMVDTAPTFAYYAKHATYAPPMNEQDKILYEAKAAVLKALAHPTRLWMAEQLAGGEKCVCEFVEVMDFDFSTISRHLAVLKRAGIVEVDKRGKQVFYRLKVPCVLNFMNCVEAVIKAQGKDRTALMKQL
jgi:ArsR family transcriptional regulator